MKKLLLATLLMCMMVLPTFADDVSHKPPKTKMPSCAMVFEQLLQVDEILFFTETLKRQFDLMLKQDKVKNTKTVQQYRKNKRLIDRQLYQWRKTWDIRLTAWEKNCETRKKVTLP